LNLAVPLADIPRANVLGVGVSAINMEDAVSIFRQAIENGSRGYVCVTGVHGVMEARKDPTLRRILNSSLLSTPDGVPMVWIGRLQGLSRMRRVFGPELMQRICEISVAEGRSHFLYGGKPGAAEQLRDVLANRFPGLQIVGTYTPPFRLLNANEEQELVEMVGRLKPDFFWVGLSTPKQEQFMARYSQLLETRLMIGVGAAFDYLTGSIRDAPSWVKSAGLQWLHRLIQEPRRLWKRYLINNPQFLWEISLQMTGLRSYPLEKF
jgi:N-acetylglucosaminyldiphosphoundecaprenol N-acetyl-beta-D-mannosaminyltransferase